MTKKTKLEQIVTIHVQSMVSIWALENKRQIEEDQKRQRDWELDQSKKHAIVATPFQVSNVKEIPTRHQSMLINLAKDPIAESLKIAAQQIGKSLYQAGGMDAMHEACERLWDIPDCGSAASLFFDRRWNGIGCWIN